MTRLILFIVSLWTVVLLSEPALANCTTSTVWMPDGRVMVCTTCGSQTSCR
jgi:hypothetical protein